MDHGPPVTPPPPLVTPPRWNGKTNGFSIVALTLSLFGCVGPISIVLAVIGLRQSLRNRDRRGRFFAIAALVVCGLWIGGFATAIVVNAAHGPDRDVAGPVPTRSAFTIHLDGRTGDCTMHGDVVPCSSPHDGEIVWVYELPDRAWPGDAQVKKTAKDTCDKKYREYAGAKAGDADFLMVASTPPRVQFPDFREIRCDALYLHGSTTGSLRK